MPESCISCGVLIAPPQRMTSPARAWCERRPRAYSTPTALPPSKMMRVASAIVSTFRLGRPSTGCR